MRKLLLILLLPFISYAQTQIGADIDGESEGERFGRSLSLNANGSIVAIGGHFYSEDNFPSRGHVLIYENQSGTWTQLGQNIDGEGAIDFFGFSVSLNSDGSIVAIGTFQGDGGEAGYVGIYENQNGTWMQIGENIDGETESDHFGWSVSLSSGGNIVAIGAAYNDGNGEDAGHVRIYENQSGIWTQIGEDIDGEAAGDNSGFSVSLSSDGSIVAIGARGNDGNGDYSGHVRIYENQNDTWIQVGADIDGEAVLDQFGWSVSLSSNGSIVAIGAAGNDGNGEASGHVRIYENQNGTWIQIGEDIDGEAAGDNSGFSVSLSSDGSLVAIGALLNEGNGFESGHVRVYQNIAETWTQIGEDIDGEAEQDSSGVSVSLSSDGSIVAIGAWLNGGNGYFSGHARVYDLSAVLTSDSFIEESFNIYPNPVSEFLTIELKSNIALESVRFYNTLGELVKTSTLSKINVSDLATGIYFVQIHTNQGEITQKVIIE